MSEAILAGPTPRTHRPARLRRPGGDQPVDARYVIERLEEAGATLLALPGTGWSTRLRTLLARHRARRAEVVWLDRTRIRPPIPSAEKITRMDEAMSWIPLIPVDRYVLRRVVGARSLVHPVTDRHLFPWRRLGKRWARTTRRCSAGTRQGIAMIVARLKRAL